MQPETTTTMENHDVSTTGTKVPDTKKNKRHGLIRRLSKRLRRRIQKKSFKAPSAPPIFSKGSGSDGDMTGDHTEVSTPPASPSGHHNNKKKCIVVVTDGTTTPAMQALTSRFMITQDDDESSFLSEDLSFMTQDTQEGTPAIVSGSMLDLGLLPRDEDSSEIGVLQDEGSLSIKIPQEEDVAENVTMSEKVVVKENDELDSLLQITTEPDEVAVTEETETQEAMDVRESKETEDVAATESKETQENMVTDEVITVKEDVAAVTENTTADPITATQPQVTHRDLDRAIVARYAASLGNHSPRRDQSPPFPAFRSNAHPRSSSSRSRSLVAALAVTTILFLVLKVQGAAPLPMLR